MIRSKTINDIVVKPVVISDKSKDKILESDLFPKLNANILIIAPKNSGKTTVIYRIIAECFIFIINRTIIIILHQSITI